MKEFIISERYRLEIHWTKTTYVEDDFVKLSNCYMSGPVISDVVEIRDKDFINLDFGKQYSGILSNYYIAKLSWEGIKIESNRIYLQNVEFRNKYINSIPRFNRGDYIVVDTFDHEANRHYKNLNYKAYLLNRDGIFCNFRR